MWSHKSRSTNSKKHIGWSNHASHQLYHTNKHNAKTSNDKALQLQAPLVVQPGITVHWTYLFKENEFLESWLMLPESDTRIQKASSQTNFNWEHHNEWNGTNMTNTISIITAGLHWQKKNLYYHTSDFLQKQENNFLRPNLFHPIADLEWVSSL